MQYTTGAIQVLRNALHLQNLDLYANICICLKYKDENAADYK